MGGGIGVIAEMQSPNEDMGSLTRALDNPRCTSITTTTRVEAS